MRRRKEEEWQELVFEFVDRHWKWLVALAWLGFCAWFIVAKWNNIHFFILSDTDDNMRMMQVRGLLGGQGWYDLRQHHLNAPIGANIHWSRLVDLPLAGLILLLRPFLGGPDAERWAVAIAPMLPYLLLLVSIALTVRRLVDRRAYPLAFLALVFAGSTNGMFMPTRIDHHGWQLALLAMCVASIADPKKVRGGLLLGIGTALSLAIGLEMIIYLAIAAAVTVLLWVADGKERERLRAYSVALGGGTAIAFLIFASNDNWLAVCDALSPVWLANALLGGALLFGLSLLSPRDWRNRLALAAVAGALVAAFHGLVWPHCLERLEGVSPEVGKLWLSHVREARPVYRHGWRIASLVVALPVTGVIGWGLLAWWKRGDRELLRRIGGAALPGVVAAMLLMWQTRTGPAAQMLATIGTSALLWHLVPKTWNSEKSLVRVLGTLALVLVGGGAALPFVLRFIPEPAVNADRLAIRRANSLCNSLWAYRPVAEQPKGVVFTFIDFGPRLITVTHHDSIGGPYHRNGEQIADVMSAFRGSAEQAHQAIRKYRSNYLLVCPNSSTTTIFRAEAPKGFYQQLAMGQVPAWLAPVDLGKDSPFRMWRVTG